MNVPATLSACAAAILFFAGVVAFVVSRAPSWRELRWFAGCAVLAGGYELTALPVTLDVSDDVIDLGARVALSLAALHVGCWLVYASEQSGPRLKRSDAVLVTVNAALSLAVLVPGLFVGRPIHAWRVAWLDAVYRDVTPTVFGAASQLLFCGCLVRLLVGYVRRARAGVPTASAHVVALGALLLGALHDISAVNRLWHTPYMVDVTMLIAVLAVAAAASRRFVATARELEASSSELAHAHQQLVRHERLAALGQLAATVAHEVRNPLAVVFNAVAALRKLEPGATEHRALLGIVQEEAERLRDIVSELLEFARPRSPVFAPAHLDRVVAHAVEAALSEADAPDDQVTVEAASEVGVILCDEQLIRQAVINLVANALQAEGRHGPVRVTITESDDNVSIRVEDDGRGVPADLRDRIFTPFFSTRPTGTGLGLAVVQRSVESHGGEVVLRPSTEGGAAFELRLPRKAA